MLNVLMTVLFKSSPLPSLTSPFLNLTTHALALATHPVTPEPALVLHRYPLPATSTSGWCKNTNTEEDRYMLTASKMSGERKTKVMAKFGVKAGESVL